MEVRQRHTMEQIRIHSSPAKLASSGSPASADPLAPRRVSRRQKRAQRGLHREDVEFLTKRVMSDVGTSDVRRAIGALRQAADENLHLAREAMKVVEVSPRDQHMRAYALLRLGFAWNNIRALIEMEAVRHVSKGAQQSFMRDVEQLQSHLSDLALSLGGLSRLKPGINPSYTPANRFRYGPHSMPPDLIAKLAGPGAPPKMTAPPHPSEPRPSAKPARPPGSRIPEGALFGGKPMLDLR